MKLKAQERNILSGLLPTECNLDKARIVRTLAESLEFTEAELKKWRVKIEGGKMYWILKEPVRETQCEKCGHAAGNPTGDFIDLDKPVDIEISEAGFTLVLGLFEDLAKKEKLDPRVHLPIYEKFLTVISNGMKADGPKLVKGRKG